MSSKYPWLVSICNGDALQFLIMDADDNLILMGEICSDEDDLLEIVRLLKQNPEISVDEKFSKTLRLKAAMMVLRENGYEVTKAAEASTAGNDGGGESP